MAGTNPSSNWIGGGPSADTNLSTVGGVAVTLGQKAMAASLPVVIANNQSAVPVTPQFTSTGDIETNTSAGDGSAWIAFPSAPCKQLTIVNATGTAMRMRFSTGTGTGVGILIPDQTSVVRAGLTNANQISIRRNDLSVAQVFIQGFWEA